MLASQQDAVPRLNAVDLRYYRHYDDATSILLFEDDVRTHT